MRFVGVDLGWKTDPPREKGTGICQVDELGRVEKVGTVTTDDEILLIVEEAGEVWVGVDASLTVHNETGLRPCERRLRDMGIKVLPTSRTFLERRFGGCRGGSLVQRSLENGFTLMEGEMLGGRPLFEVFPHGTLHVMGGGRRPNYKKGSDEQKAEGRRQVIELVRGWEPSIEVPHILHESGMSAKEMEDILDAWVCVACIYSHWLNGGRTTQLIGEEGDGHILLGCHRHE